MSKHSAPTPEGDGFEYDGPHVTPRERIETGIRELVFAASQVTEHRPIDRTDSTKGFDLAAAAELYRGAETHARFLMFMGHNEQADLLRTIASQRMAEYGLPANLINYVQQDVIAQLNEERSQQQTDRGGQ